MRKRSFSPPAPPHLLFEKESCHSERSYFFHLLPIHPQAGPPQPRSLAPAHPEALPAHTVSSECFSSKSWRDETCGFSSAEPDKYFSSRRRAARRSQREARSAFYVKKPPGTPGSAAPPSGGSRRGARACHMPAPHAPRSPLFGLGAHARPRRLGGAAGGTLRDDRGAGPARPPLAGTGPKHLERTPQTLGKSRFPALWGKRTWATPPCFKPKAQRGVRGPGRAHSS